MIESTLQEIDSEMNQLEQRLEELRKRRQQMIHNLRRSRPINVSGTVPTKVRDILKKILNSAPGNMLGSRMAYKMIRDELGKQYRLESIRLYVAASVNAGYFKRPGRGIITL